MAGWYGPLFKSMNPLFLQNIDDDNHTIMERINQNMGRASEIAFHYKLNECEYYTRVQERNERLPYPWALEHYKDTLFYTV